MKWLFDELVLEQATKREAIEEIVSRNNTVKTRISLYDDEQLWKSKISKEEVDVKPKISKWWAFFEKQKLNNEINKMHVYDITMTRGDLMQNLKILNKNIDKLASSDGFKELDG